MTFLCFFKYFLKQMIMNVLIVQAFVDRALVIFSAWKISSFTKLFLRLNSLSIVFAK